MKPLKDKIEDLGFMNNEILIREALSVYGMTEATHEIIRHNENITCKVMYKNTNYLLRIHKPVEGFSISLVTNGKSEIELFKSEVALLQYLKTNGFKEIQQPVKNLQGENVTVLEGEIPAMMLTWIEGKPINPEEGSKYAEALGELACKIHKASKGFTQERIRYNQFLCDRMINEIHIAVNNNHISKAAGEICIREIEAVKSVQNKHISECSLVHADMGFGNILVTKNGLIPIDFSLSGYGCEAQEAGMLMSNYQDDESCRKVLEGFAKCGSVIDPEEADIFLSYSVLLFICTQHEKVYKEEWFAGALNRWCKELFFH